MNIKRIETRKTWTPAETRQVINLYRKFLRFELDNVKYQKAADVRALAGKLGRSKGSIEAKLMNISGVLADHGRKWVKGYKPASNYAKAMKDQVLSAIGPGQ